MYLFPVKPVSNFNALYLLYKTLQEDIFLLLTINTKDIFFVTTKEVNPEKVKEI